MNRRYRYADENQYNVTTRQTKWFIQNPRSKKMNELQRSLYAHMLIEDMHLGIIPYNAKKTPEYKILISPDDKKAEEIICFGLPNNYGERRNPTEAIEHFLDYITQIIAYEGKAFFEIVFCRQSDDEKAQRFRLEHIPYGTLFKRWGSYIQRGSFYDTTLGRNEKYKTIIANDRIVHFELPDILGGARNYKRILQALVNLNEVSLTPKFATPQYGMPLGPAFFDFSRYNLLLQTEIYRNTRKLGWHARQYSSDKVMEFYSVYRILKFELSKAYLRENIIRTLNSVLQSIGKVISPAIQIEILGLPNSDDISNTIDSLNAGDTGFNDALKKVMRI